MLFSLILVLSSLPFAHDAHSIRFRRGGFFSKDRCAELHSKFKPLPVHVRLSGAGKPARGWQNAPWGSRKKVRFMTYNMYNLYMHLGRAETQTESGARNSIPAREKNSQKIGMQAAAILDVRPDIVAVQEIESSGRKSALSNLDDFCRNELKGEYRPVMASGSNDQRGLEMGFLLHRSLGRDIEVKVRSHANRKWVNPMGITKRPEPVFVRDFPLMLLKKKGDRKAFMAYGVVHLKSKRVHLERGDTGTPADWDRANRKARLRASREVEEIVKILAEFRRENPETPFMISGDFNTDLGFAPELRPLIEFLKMQEGMNLIPGRQPTLVERTTSFLFKGKNQRQNHQVDGNFLSEHLQKFVIDSWVYRYRTIDGEEMPFPETYEQREQELPSDHYPVVVDVSTDGWPDLP